MNTLNLTLHEFRNLIETDDSLEPARAWLIRNTAAAGECTVIQPAHAAAIQAADPDGSIIHIQPYATADGEVVFTAWHPLTWSESEERRRLHKIANSTWRAEHDTRQRCYDAARDFARMMHAAFGTSATEYEIKFSAVAQGLAFNEAELKRYLDGIDAKFNVRKYYEETTKQRG